MTGGFAANVPLYRWSRFLRNLLFWQAVWFLYFQNSLSAAEAILLYAVYDVATTALEVPSGYMSDRIGRRFTLLASAVRNDLDVWAYVKDILDQLLAGETDYSKLAPDAWKASHPEAIREYRVEERRDRADRKQARRARRRAVSACEAE
mgnify:CR=1 FL=1